MIVVDWLVSVVSWSHCLAWYQSWCVIKIDWCSGMVQQLIRCPNKIFHVNPHQRNVSTLSRYSLMMSCWAEQPNDRPNFNNIVTNISNYAEAIAGYLNLNCFNPFKSTHSLYDNAAAITTIPSSPCYEKDVLDSTELLEQQSPSNKVKSKDDSTKGKSPKGSPKVTPKVTPKSSPKSSPKPSPRASPRMSPRTSPLLKLKKTKNNY